MSCSGKRKAGSPVPVPFARAAGPPRSRCQYHSAKAMTLLIQTMAPTASSCPGVAKSALSRIPTTSRNAESAAPRVITAIITPVVTRSQRFSRSIRPGSPTIRIPSSTRRKAG